MAMIPHSKPSLGPDDIRAVTDVLRSGQVAGGPAVSQFERGMAAYLGVQGGVAVSSIRPQWKEAEDDYKTLECRADVAGNLQSLAHFLYQVERDPLGVKVDTLELTTRNTEGSQLALVVQVSGLLLNPSKKNAR